MSEREKVRRFLVSATRLHVERPKHRVKFVIVFRRRVVDVERTERVAQMPAVGKFSPAADRRRENIIPVPARIVVIKREHGGRFEIAAFRVPAERRNKRVVVPASGVVVKRQKRVDEFPAVFVSEKCRENPSAVIAARCLFPIVKQREQPRVFFVFLLLVAAEQTVKQAPIDFIRLARSFFRVGSAKQKRPKIPMRICFRVAVIKIQETPIAVAASDTAEREQPPIFPIISPPKRNDVVEPGRTIGF